MPCHQNVRDRINVKLDGWHAYVRAIGTQLEPHGNDVLDRVQARKNRLREALERLEREAHEASTLADAASSRLCRESLRLRRALSTPRPATAAAYATQRRAIAAAMAAMEAEMNAVTLSPGNEAGLRFNTIVERTIRAMVNLEAEMEVGLIRFRQAGDGGKRAEQEREITERLRVLADAISLARSMPDDSANLAEAEIASGVRRVQELYSALAR